MSLPWRIIEPETPGQFAAMFELRWQILRAPWNQPRGSERDEHEENAVHALILDARDRPIGTGRLHRLDNATGQIRYMAIIPPWRGKRLGSALLDWLERRAREMGMKHIRLDAREESAGFYLAHGYEDRGAGHVLYGEIRHRRMYKILVGGEPP